MLVSQFYSLKVPLWLKMKNFSQANWLLSLAARNWENLGEMECIKSFIISGSTQCILGILCRFELLQYFFRKNPLIMDCICTFYEFAATSTCINLCAFCMVRVLCLSNASFMEERVGEKKIRVVVSTLSLTTSLLVVGGLIYSGEIGTGSIVSLATSQVIPGGILILENENKIVNDYTCNRISVLVLERTTSVPKSVLRYDVDKDLTSVWYSVFIQSCFPNKKNDSRWRVKQFIFEFIKRGD